MPLSPDDLVSLRPEGLYCARGDFHIDPWRAVDRALITHAHSDHARRGSRLYHAAASGVGFLQHRLGGDAAIEGHAFGERLPFGDTVVSFHPAGHVLGSAQIRVEADGEVWVISGDYKRDADPSCEPFEIVPCDVFVTEATFALPIYRWDPATAIGALEEVVAWWREANAGGRSRRGALLLRASARRSGCSPSSTAARIRARFWLHGAMLDALTRGLPRRLASSS